MHRKSVRPPPQRSREERQADRHARREKALAIIRANPGIQITGVVEAMDLGWSTVYTTLRRLEMDGLISTQSVGRRTFVYPAGAGADQEFAHAKQASALVSPQARAVAMEICNHPGQHTVASLAEATQISPRTVYHHVRRFVAEGLVRSYLPTRYKELVANDILHELLKR